ncbi:jmjd-1.2, partial [Pristionchus pacificus]
ILSPGSAMEQPKVEVGTPPIDNASSDSPPNLVSPGMNADPAFPQVKSPILRKWIASTHMPKFEPMDNSSIMTPDSIQSEGTPSESKSPPLTAQLSVDTSFTSPLKDPATSYYQCRACNELHRMNEEYPDKRSPIEEGDDPHWISCDGCLNWFHCECVDLEPYETFLIDMFYCVGCHPKFGPSKEKVCVAPHRNKFDALDEVDKPSEIGTKPWIDEFIKDEATKYGPPPADLVKVIEIGHDFEGQFDRNAEWKHVYLVKKKAGLGLQMPEPGEMYIDELVEILGAKRLVETIDVYRQASVLMSVGRYRELLMRADRPRLFNILSLEFTGTKLADMVRPPSIVKELSWAERYWPDRNFGPPDTLPSGAEEACDSAHTDMRPDVELFCLMGMGGSFTDFHIDFGGSSVWYHVYKGQKIFYIVEPTTENLDIYQKHQLRTDREVFLGDIYGDKCWRVVIDEGSTLMIPAGWIHAVYTPVDSLVFGGNFLTNLNVELQCEVNSHENRCLFESR